MGSKGVMGKMKEVMVVYDMALAKGYSNIRGYNINAAQI